MSLHLTDYEKEVLAKMNDEIKKWHRLCDLVSDYERSLRNVRVCDAYRAFLVEKIVKYWNGGKPEENPFTTYVPMRYSVKGGVFHPVEDLIV